MGATEKPQGDTRSARNWVLVKDLIRRGLCRNCRKRRGKHGTGQHCRKCADDHNAECRARWEAIKERLKAMDGASA